MLRVHLMSAGRLRYLAPGAKGPKTPMFRLRFTGRRRARPHRGREEEARRRLARHAGAARRGPRPPRAGRARARRGRRSPRSSDASARQLHPLLRDQRALAGIGRAHANEILLRARLSPFKASTELSDEEIERLATAMHDDLTRALELRERGKGDSDVYVVHNRLGEPCPQCGTPIARVDFEEHTIYYCPSCQTGGRLLKDRRLSRLLALSDAALATVHARRT